MTRSFQFPAKVDDVPRYARQVIDALGERFDRSLVMASLSEALLNAVAYGALRLPASLPDRDPVAFIEAARLAEASAGPNTRVLVTVTPAPDDPEDKLVRITDPGPGFDWRRRMHALADANAAPTPEELLFTSGRGISIILAGSHGVLWNDAGNEITLRFRASNARPPLSNPPAPIRISVFGNVGHVSATAATLEGIPIPSLPLAQEEQPAAPAPSPRPASHAHEPKEGRILVVDDIEVNRRILQHMLQWEGFDVRVARDGPEALAAAEEWSPDIMVLDLNMPRMSGIDVVREMRRRKMLRSTSVMVLTAAAADEATRVAALDAGACDFLEKPISRRELIARVQRRLIAMREMQAVDSERARLQEGVTSAAELMQALLPEARVRTGSALISHIVIPCDSVGGDLVDFCQLDPTRWFVLLADVAGHGLAAALTASSTRAILRDRLTAGRSLQDAFEALNERLSDDFDRTGRQAAVAAVLVDETQGTTSVLNAGCPPISLRTTLGRWIPIRSSAPPAGLVTGMKFPVSVFPTAELARVILVSDGLTEAFSKSSDAIGALRHVVGAYALDSGPEIPLDVRAKLTALGPAEDDMSIAWIDFCND